MDEHTTDHTPDEDRIMPNETTLALQEIANLLRRRVEQQDEVAESTREMVKRSEERMARIDGDKPDIFDMDKFQEQVDQRTSPAMERIEKQQEERERQRRQVEEEEREFRDRLLIELERHNSLLERLLTRLEG